MGRGSTWNLTLSGSVLARVRVGVPKPFCLRAEHERFKLEGPAPIVYDPTDGDELAEREAKERARARDEDDPPGGIGR